MVAHCADLRPVHSARLHIGRSAHDCHTSCRGLPSKAIAALGRAITCTTLRGLRTYLAGVAAGMIMTCVNAHSFGSEGMLNALALPCMCCLCMYASMVRARSRVFVLSYGPILGVRGCDPICAKGIP